MKHYTKIIKFFLMAPLGIFLSVAHSQTENTEAQFDPTLAIINALIQSSNDQELVDRADEIYQEDSYAALALYIAATRENTTNALAPYYAASTLFSAEQNKLGMTFLSLANERGMIDFAALQYNKNLDKVRDNEDFIKIANEIKAHHQIEEQKTAGKMDYVLPNSTVTHKNGYPVIVWLHGYRINGNVQRDLFLANALNSAVIGINGTNLEDYDAYSWNLEDYPKIHDAIQKGLDELAKVTKIDRNKVYVYGFSQGAAAAGRMLATYPTFYRGGLIIAPSYFNSDLPINGDNQRIILTHGINDFENIIKATQLMEPAFKQHNTLQYIKYEGQHHFPADWETLFIDHFQWIMQ